VVAVTEGNIMKCIKVQRFMSTPCLVTIAAPLARMLTAAVRSILWLHRARNEDRRERTEPGEGQYVDLIAPLCSMKENEHSERISASIQLQHGASSPHDTRN
jgi:hypothetical protein